MKRIITVFGAISGAIVSLMLIATVPFMKDMKHGMLAMAIGYASMLLAFCFIFIGIKTHRDKNLGGSITFGQAFGTGIWIAIIASFCYTLTWVIIYKGFYPDFMDHYVQNELSNMQKQGKSAAEIAKHAEEMKGMMAMYNTWPGLIGMTLLEILPIGILVTLISSLILKRKARAIADTPEFA